MRQTARPRSWFGLHAHHLRSANHPIISNFFGDRGSHPAAMVAYYALLSLLPFLFLAIALWAWAQSHTPTVLGVASLEVVLSVLFSSAVSVAFLYVVYRYVPNVDVRGREVWLGVAFAAVTFQASFQALPLYLRFSGNLP